ncbi:endolytic transglycosylase MltG [Borreliella sinica]|uniref:endolytic transglycosylase MltG n=1 Tax=Borreliella sinica TaxID=87162 RepID=UPI002A23ADA6|nr:endolytic transglycosylase MltG [Borreliella sinica]WPM05633.1 endolytic transglycosylase MltG [Borreliella sinica]
MLIKIGKVFIILFFLGSILSIFIYFLNLSSLASGLVYEFDVEKGWGVKKIAKELKRQKLIKSELLLVLISYIFDSDKQFKEGRYLINSDLSTFQIYKEFLRGASNVNIDVTIPEGYTSRRIAFKLKEFSIIDDVQDFIFLINEKSFICELGFDYDSLEGFLFPDTYKFYKGMEIKNVVRMFVDNFFNKLKSIGVVSSDYSSKELYNRVIIASIVEREYRVRSEAPIMSSVFYNRIKSGMALQSCATIEYVITEELGRSHPKRIYFSDLEIDSPYNTYINKGYPPTPISNAGIISLQAAFFPRNTQYLFFVVKDSKLGTHQFSSDYSSHLLGAKDYIKNFITKD